MSRPVSLGMVNLLLRQESLTQRRERLLSLIEAAGRGGCQIVLLPEFADHHCTQEVGQAAAGGPAEVRRVAGLTLESSWLRQVAALAARYGMVAIPDVLLIDGDHATNTALVYGPDGALLGQYAKTHLAPGERQTCAAGDAIETIATPFGRLGLLICWDIHFPELTRVHELQGADLLLWTTMRQAESEEILWRAVLPARCWDHSLPLGVSTYVTAHQVPLRRPMAATVFSAFGQVIAGGMCGEGVVQGTVDLDERPHDRRYWGRPDWVDAGSYYRRYRRPDLYAPLTAALAPVDADPDVEAETARYPDLVNPVL